MVKISHLQGIQRPVFHMTNYPANCVKMKEEATSLFKSGRYGDAAAKYSQLITRLESGEALAVILVFEPFACNLSVL